MAGPTRRPPKKVQAVNTAGQYAEEVIDVTATETVDASADQTSLAAPLPRRTEIDKLGLGTHIIEMRTNGFTMQEIADQLTLDPGSVSRYLHAYDAKSEADKAAIRNSVFSISENMEMIFGILIGELDALKAEQEENNVDNKLKVIDRLLKQMDTAMKLQERNEIYVEMKRFQEAFMAEMQEESPGIQQRMIARMNTLNQAWNQRQRSR